MAPSYSESAPLGYGESMTNRPYHHGDLREALLREGLAIVHEAGAEGLRVRELARRVGVSHAAAYRHFKDREDLLNAIAIEGFSALTDAVQAAGKQASSPQARLAGGVHAYMDHAQAHPARYRLMFSRGADPLTHPALAAAAAASFMVLVTDATNLGHSDPHRAATMAWATLHGLAHLSLDGLIAVETAAELAQEALTRLLLEPART
jgi:AcrR family transcriptional regulator